MHEPDQHVSPIKNWKQLVVVVALAFIVPIAVIIILAQYVTGIAVAPSENESAVLSRIKPIGEVLLGVPGGPKGQLTGEQVYGQVCKTCHESGLAGAPKLGDKTAWAKVIAQGLATTVDHAVKGVRAMPPKGGNPDYENIEIERAVVFMANQAGANWKAAPPTATAQGAERTGEEVVNLVCARCHATGERGAPKIGDSAAWTPRVAKGLATVTQAALKGHGGMPARAGMADLSDTEIKRAIEYMFNSGLVKTAAAAAPATPAVAAPAGGKADGKKIYDATCGGLSWRRRGRRAQIRRQGRLGAAPQDRHRHPVCERHQGQGRDAAKGGNASLADADVKAAVDYMVAAAK